MIIILLLLKIVFLKYWTNAPFLVRDDNGLFYSSDGSPYLVWNAKARAPQPANPWFPSHVDPALNGSYSVNGISCRPAWQLFTDMVEACSPEGAEKMTWGEAEDIRRGARPSVTPKP